MFKLYLNNFLIRTIQLLIAFGIFIFFVGCWFLGADLLFELLLLPYVLIPLIVLLLFLSTYFAHSDLRKLIREEYKDEIFEAKKQLEQTYEKHKHEISKSNEKHLHKISKIQSDLRLALLRKGFVEKEVQAWKKAILERSSGFPTLVKVIQDYEKLKDDYLTEHLLDKSHPAKKASEIVKEQSARRREAEFEAKTTKGILDYYESIAPFLIDLKNDIIDPKEEESIFKEYDQSERQDPVTNYLTKEEYRKLPSTERNQMALDRFWDRNKSKRLIGRLYERYVGYLYEKEGYQVDYIGIFKGFEDLGRDLICKKENEYIIIQCKYWSHFKTIYEKHIFQFFGTVFQYRDSFPSQNVHAIFYTSTQLSDLARRFANELKIELKENCKLDKSYPCIKCNINISTKEHIYHLPFDQQYDRTKIVNDGEFYSPTVRIAEEAGFRRAFRWQGNNKED